MEVSLERGEAIVEALAAATPQAMEKAVKGKVILSWARWLLARVPLLGRGAP